MNNNKMRFRDVWGNVFHLSSSSVCVQDWATEIKACPVISLGSSQMNMWTVNNNRKIVHSGRAEVWKSVVYWRAEFVHKQWFKWLWTLSVQRNTGKRLQRSIIKLRDLPADHPDDQYIHMTDSLSNHWFSDLSHLTNDTNHRSGWNTVVWLLSV